MCFCYGRKLSAAQAELNLPLYPSSPQAPGFRAGEAGVPGLSQGQAPRLPASVAGVTCSHRLSRWDENGRDALSTWNINALQA